GYNRGLKHIDKPWVVLLNSDVEVTKNWLYTIESIFNNNNQIGIIQPKILDYKKKSHFEYAGAAGGFIDRFGFPFCRGRIFEYLEEDKGQFEAQEEIFWASGACLCIRKNIFDELGGFDTDFFAHQEEIDLCWRAFNNGYKTIYTPESVVYHIGGATLNASSPLKTYLNFRNSLFMLVKNVPTESLFWVLIFRMIQDGIAAFKFLFEGKSNHFFAVGKSHFSFYLSFYKMYKKRKKTQKSNYFKINSIVFNYYVKKNMIYKNLFNTNL
ncbi:MAG TPA: dTDP-Rha--alpha-D-GlcNAc-pyrophosphate polyprenol alpha-3-L-rhamnosyltransferase, partial [Flavobacterium sp.]|nr:dTDP-Rha--alpha-D-GlcNAc-pyrophosphate polyprenol alpha-3-L-rhamnosyltransferase [Flavobacterium sp.]